MGRFLILLILLVGACKSEPARPHVVVLLADDMGYGDIERYNANSRIPTPHLNRMADEGIRFTDAHSPSAVCTPTRYGLLTGRYAWRTHLKQWVLVGHSPSLIDSTRLTLPKLFQKHGYVTGGFGKWHLGLGERDSTHYTLPLDPGPVSSGFEHYFGIPSSLDFPPYVYIRNTSVEELPTDWIEASAHRRQGGGGFWRAGGIGPQFRHRDVLPRITDEAIAFIREHASRDPIFLYVAFSAPHTPWLPSDTSRYTTGAGYYGDFVADVDQSVGRILEAIDGLDRNSLVLFTSDNGAHWPQQDRVTFGHDANGPWRGQKADIWEAGHRVPFIARWLGIIDSGRTSDHLISHTDLLATAASLLGATLPDGAGGDSIDFLAGMLGVGTSARTSMIHHSGDGMFALRDRNWKLIEGRGSGGFTRPQRLTPKEGEPPGQLYNLADDPAEVHNLYAAAPETAARLLEQLEHIISTPKSQ